MHVSVNMDAQSWNNSEVMKIFEDLSKKGFAKRITIEILETVHLTRGSDEKLAQLRRLGFDSAVDDYGTGQSGPERLLDAKSKFLKIDMKTVARLENEDTRKEGLILIRSAV